jgi:hypothetical protein
MHQDFSKPVHSVGRSVTRSRDYSQSVSQSQRTIPSIAHRPPSDPNILQDSNINSFIPSRTFLLLHSIMMRSILQTTLRRHISLFILQRNFSPSRPALAALANETNDGCYQSLIPAWFFLSASLAAAATTTRCEEEEPQQEEEEQEQEDPYDNLPEKDEDTHCSICMTYRQGPCRPYWRKVEACTKDNELKEDDKEEKEGGKENEQEEDSEEEDSEEEHRDPPCLKYMLPWIDCASGFRSLYNLIELDTNYTMGIVDLENEASKNLCWAPSNTPTIDWSSWQAYLEKNEEWTLPKSPESIPTEKTALWKTLDQSKDPELVEVQATVNMIQENGILECAYAQDQDGNVIGFQYGTKPSDAAKAKEEKEEKQESTVTLKIRILPERTQTVTIAAAYTEIDENKEESKGEDSFHSYILKSRPYSIDKVAKASTHD